MDLLGLIIYSQMYAGQANDREGDMGGGGALNTATPQKNLTNTASPQEKSTKHRHRNNYFQLHNFNVFI